MFVLHAAKGTIAVASHIALEESGLPYQVEWVDFASAAQRSPAYLALNPKGRVPALVTPDGVLTETPAILGFIAEAAPELAPDTRFARAQVAEMLSYCASTFHVNYAHKMRGSRWSDDASAHASMAAKVPQTMAESCAYVESRLPAQGWVLGADFSVADIHLYAICRWLEGDGVAIADYPRLSAHFAAMQARAAVATVEKLHR